MLQDRIQDPQNPNLSDRKLSIELSQGCCTILIEVSNPPKKHDVETRRLPFIQLAHYVLLLHLLVELAGQWQNNLDVM